MLTLFGSIQSFVNYTLVAPAALFVGGAGTTPAGAIRANAFVGSGTWWVVYPSPRGKTEPPPPIISDVDCRAPAPAAWPSPVPKVPLAGLGLALGHEV